MFKSKMDYLKMKDHPEKMKKGFKSMPTRKKKKAVGKVDYLSARYK